MSYLIDSDVIVSFLEADLDTISLLDELFPAGVAISIVTYMETYQGVLRTKDIARSEQRHAEVVQNMAIIQFTEAMARTCARLRQALTADGKRMRDRSLDLMIAATAIELDMILVTRNLSDYRDIPGLQIFS